jgi:hypothetical protein
MLLHHERKINDAGILNPVKLDVIPAIRLLSMGVNKLRILFPKSFGW